MKKFQAVSRVSVVPVMLFIANASATCPLFQNKLSTLANDNKYTIAATVFADTMYAKNEHAKKAFTCSTVNTLGGKKIEAHEFVERFFIDYGIRVGSEAIGVDGLKKSLLKKCDVLPDSMARDLVNPVVEGVADVATHPEMLTYLAMAHVLPFIVGALGGKSGSVK